MIVIIDNLLAGFGWLTWIFGILLLAAALRFANPMPKPKRLLTCTAREFTFTILKNVKIGPHDVITYTRYFLYFKGLVRS